jgi:hypothetical protein
VAVLRSVLNYELRITNYESFAILLIGKKEGIGNKSKLS